MAAPRSQAPVLVLCCKKPGRSSRSDTGRRRGAQCTAEPSRRSSDAHKSRCSCRRAHRTKPIHRCRPIHRWFHRDRQRQTRRRALQRRRRRPRRQTRRRDRQRHRCRRHPTRLRHREEGRPRPGSRRRSRRRCRARNQGTRPDSARSHQCPHRRRVRPPIQPHRHFRPRALRLLLLRRIRPRSIHHRLPGRASRSIHTLQPRATGGEPCLVASSRAPGQHHACHAGSRGNFPGVTRSASRIRAGLSQFLRKLRQLLRDDSVLSGHSVILPRRARWS
jgi:hypothetical protein